MTRTAILIALALLLAGCNYTYRPPKPEVKWKDDTLECRTWWECTDLMWGWHTL